MGGGLEEWDERMVVRVGALPGVELGPESAAAARGEVLGRQAEELDVAAAAVVMEGQGVML